MRLCNGSPTFLFVSLMLLPLASAPLGCSDSPGSGVDLGALDTNGDGRLTDADVEVGQAALLLGYHPPDGQGDPILIRHTTRGGFVLFDQNEIMCPPGWGAQFPVDDIDGVEDFSVAIWFHDSDLESELLTAGQSDVFVVAADFPAVEHGGGTPGPFVRPMTITDSTGTTSSGFFDAQVDIDVAFYVPDPPRTGESVVVYALSFDGVTVREPGPVAGRCDDPPNSCQAVFEDECFGSVEEACEAAQCENGCNSLDTLPAIVGCAE